MRPKLLFVVTEDWYFWSHRLPIARAALRAGYDVVVATRVSTYADRITTAGFRLIPLQLSRGSYSPREEFRSIGQLRSIYRQERPQIVHHVALKPILYGSIAALGQKEMKVVNAFAGLGYLAASSSMKARVLRPMVWSAMRFLLNRPQSHLLLQNREDKDVLMGKLKVPPEKITVIRGSGVNVEVFQPTTEPIGTPVVLLASRMLWIKGVQQFVAAAQMLRKKGLSPRFILAGDGDPNSPSCVPRQELLDWQNSGAVEWWGHNQDMTAVFRQANVVCLPSHGGEGVPKVLMEAAASGRAIITTDVPGCRDIVRDGVNGLLVPPKDVPALAHAIEKLLNDPPQREQMAIHGRNIAVTEFSEDVVVRQTLEMYSGLLGAAAPREGIGGTEPTPPLAETNMFATDHAEKR
ncbi:MAG TPA: glycosyltransferase family 4 protein [Candidatus Angelobacter sp.]